nr:HAD family hydrolase [Candidatus Sigynarchaeum springense]
MNGTLALDGMLIEGVSGRIAELKMALVIYLISSDTHGTAKDIAFSLGIDRKIIVPGKDERKQKAAFVKALGKTHVAAIGNGQNDALMLKEAILGVCVVGHEGGASGTLATAKIVVTNPLDALDLFRFPKRLTATLRK